MAELSGTTHIPMYLNYRLKKISVKLENIGLGPLVNYVYMVTFDNGKRMYRVATSGKPPEFIINVNGVVWAEGTIREFDLGKPYEIVKIDEKYHEESDIFVFYIELR